MVDDTPRDADAARPTAEPDPAERTGSSRAPEEEQTPLQKAAETYDLVSDIVTPQRIMLLLAALVLLVVGIFGGWQAVEDAEENLPATERSQVIEADPFEIAVNRVRWAPSLDPIAPKRDGKRHLFVVMDVTNTWDRPLPAATLTDAVRLEADGLTEAYGKVEVASYRLGDGLQSGHLQPNLTTPTVLVYSQDASLPLPEELTIVVRKHTKRPNSMTQSIGWYDAKELTEVTVPVEEVKPG